LERLDKFFNDHARTEHTTLIFVALSLLSPAKHVKTNNNDETKLVFCRRMRNKHVNLVIKVTTLANC